MSRRDCPTSTDQVPFAPALAAILKSQPPCCMLVVLRNELDDLLRCATLSKAQHRRYKRWLAQVTKDLSKMAEHSWERRDVYSENGVATDTLSFCEHCDVPAAISCNHQLEKVFYAEDETETLGDFYERCALCSLLDFQIPGTPAYVAEQKTRAKINKKEG
jgi:hypothetical protein